jgi:hypothetical protein
LSLYNATWTKVGKVLGPLLIFVMLTLTIETTTAFNNISNLLLTFSHWHSFVVPL